MELVEKAMNLAELEAVCRSCRLCPLAETRQNVVFGEGSGESGIFILGEAPGEKEDHVGRPFVGKAGEVLNRALECSRLKRQQVFITGSLKCRPPRNRNPHRGEVDACRVYLDHQLRLLKPKIVVCMGLVAVRNILGIRSKLKDIRGCFFNGSAYRVLPTYHPAAVLRGVVKADYLYEDFRLAAFEVGLIR